MQKVAVIGLYGMSALFSVEHFPEVGETIHSKGLFFEPGGKGYNQAIGALKAGADVFFATAVGSDGFGSEAEAIFQKDGLNDFVCMHVDDCATAFASVTNDESGDNTVIVNQGACAFITPEMIDTLEDKISECQLLLLQCEIPLPSVHRALELGKKHGLYTILNPAPAKRLSPELLKLVDLLTPNRIEASSIAGIDDDPETASKALMDMGCKNVIITMGGDGSYVHLQDGPGYVQPGCTVSCVDSTGAGDNFNGALAARLACGWSFQDSVRYATASSALSVTRRGVMPAIPTEAEVNRFIADSFSFTQNKPDTPLSRS